MIQRRCRDPLSRHEGADYGEAMTPKQDDQEERMREELESR